jgi:hypothetical protein
MGPTLVESNEHGLETYKINQVFGNADDVHLLVVQYNYYKNSEEFYLENNMIGR